MARTGIFGWLGVRSSPTRPFAAGSCDDGRMGQPTLEVAIFDGVASVTLGDTLLTLWQAPARAARIRARHQRRGRAHQWDPSGGDS